MRKSIFVIFIGLLGLFAYGPTRAQSPAGLTMDVLYLDGQNAFVQLPPNIFNHLSTATVEAWVKWETFNQYSRVFDFGREDNAADVHNYKTGSKLRFDIYDRRGKEHRIEVDDAVRTGIWHHIAAVCGLNGMSLYIDGRLVGTDGFTGGLSEVGGGQNYIGKSNWPDDKLFQGHLAEFRVWNRPRSPQEINA